MANLKVVRFVRETESVKQLRARLLRESERQPNSLSPVQPLLSTAPSRQPRSRLMLPIILLHAMC